MEVKKVGGVGRKGGRDLQRFIIVALMESTPME